MVTNHHHHRYTKVALAKNFCVLSMSYNKERIQLGGLTTAAASGLFSSPLVPSIKKLFFSREICGKNNGLIHQKDYFLIHLERGFRGQKYRP